MTLLRSATYQYLGTTNSPQFRPAAWVEKGERHVFVLTRNSRADAPGLSVCRSVHKFGESTDVMPALAPKRRGAGGEQVY